MTQFKEGSLKYMFKRLQRGDVGTKIINLRVLCIVIQNAQIKPG